ncbi:putative defensin-like protein 53 [Brassica napus]|uniref:(rape) hypothetical protein n=1 Tax=Brassica napus TaxID=3708 RepID=A0A816I3R9_BRANA|nr:putative defensin-like protein 53 [Brassica napus]CAF1701074.1 unnamed protein product [Brassica napus]
MAITKTSVTLFLLIALAISMFNCNVVAASVPPNCYARCVPGRYELRECVHDCIVKRQGYTYGRCVPNPNGKCCCNHE